MPDAQVLAELTASAQVNDLREIGRGAAATVYLGRQPQFDRSIAVKILNAPLVDEKSLRRFARERQALGRVGQHPNVVSVHSSGTTASGYAYLVMDYCQGGSLAARLPGQPLSVAETTEIGVKLASALAWAHAANMLHRDIKPANVLLTSLGQPVLADFGIAAVEIGEMSVTLHESLTPIHAAPEVLLNGGGDQRSDVWSLASTLYTLVAGRPPFAAEMPESLMAVLTRVMQSALPPLQAPDSGPLFAVLSRALTKDPAARMQTAAEFGAALQQAQRESGRPVTTFLVGTPTDNGAPVPTDPPRGFPPGSTAPPNPAPPTHETPTPRSRHALIGSLVGALAVVAIIGAVVVNGGGGRKVGVLAAAPLTAVPSPPAAVPAPTSPAPTTPPAAAPVTPTALPTATAPTAPTAPTSGASPAATTDPSGAPLVAQPITRASPFGAGPLPFIPAVTANAFDLTRETVVSGKGGAVPTHIYTRDLVLGKGKALAAGDRRAFVLRESKFNFQNGTKDPYNDWAAAQKMPDIPASAAIDFLSLDDGPFDPGLGIIGMKPGGRREIVVPDGPGAGNTFIIDYLGPAPS